MSHHVLVRRCRRGVVVAAALGGVLCAGLGIAPVAGATTTHGEIALTEAGTSTWTAPDGVTTVEVAAWGGGGGGGEGDWINGGGGGGLDSTYLDVTPAATYSVTVGGGGAGGQLYLGNGQAGGFLVGGWGGDAASLPVFVPGPAGSGGGGSGTFRGGSAGHAGVVVLKW